MCMLAVGIPPALAVGTCSLVPRPFSTNGLVHTVGACVQISVKSFESRRVKICGTRILSSVQSPRIAVCLLSWSESTVMAALTC